MFSLGLGAVVRVNWFPKMGEVMSHQTIGRRTFLTRAGAAALTAAGALHVKESRAQEPVPNSSGTEAPRLKAPANACDCHHHVYDARFPFSQPGARMVPSARVADYRLLQRRIGTIRSVVVTRRPILHPSPITV